MTARTDEGCCWPLWADNEKATHVYCDAERAGRLPYCEARAAAAYWTPPPRTAAPAEAA